MESHFQTEMLSAFANLKHQAVALDNVQQQLLEELFVFKPKESKTLVESPLRDLIFNYECGDKQYGFFSLVSVPVNQEDFVWIGYSLDNWLVIRKQGGKIMVWDTESLEYTHLVAENESALLNVIVVAANYMAMGYLGKIFTGEEKRVLLEKLTHLSGGESYRAFYESFLN